jgi:hypothetical protein
MMHSEKKTPGDSAIRTLLRRLPVALLFTLTVTLITACSNPTDPQRSRPVFLSTPGVEAQVDSLYCDTVHAHGLPAPVYRLIESPEEMTLNSHTGELLWTPTDSSEFKETVVIESRNDAGVEQQTFHIRVGGLQIEGLTTSNFSTESVDYDLIEEMLSLRLAGEWPKIHSIIILKDRKLVLEEYFPGRTYDWLGPLGDSVTFDRNTRHQQCSATKSITSLLVGIALDRGLIDSVHQSVLDFFPQYESYENWSEFKSRITLQHLLTMTGGFPWDDESGMAFTVIYPTNDWVKATLDLPVIYEPGSRWAYHTPSPHVLGAVVAEASGMSLPAFAQQYLYEPLGISDVEWYMTPGGRAFGGGCQKLRPIDMAKIGLMIQDGGRWEGMQVVSASWIAESTAATNPQYGYLWWRWRYDRRGVIHNATVAAGAGGQRILVIPELGLVVVTTGGYYFDAESEGFQHVHDIVQNYILPAI